VRTYKTILDIYKISIAHSVFGDNEDRLKNFAKTFFTRSRTRPRTNQKLIPNIWFYLKDILVTKLNIRGGATPTIFGIVKDMA